MQVIPAENSCAYGEPGIFRGELRFDSPQLAGYSWPLCEIRGHQPGPRFCISAGVHVNEVSSIEAAVRLQTCFDPETMKGVVSIIPLVNQPARFVYSEYVCPEDGKNINFTFPGKPDGSFSEVLCDALTREWCADADCYLDMHGGDLREQVSRFVMFQRTPDSALEARGREMALCFDADLVVGLPRTLMEAPGRPPTAFASLGKLSVMTEAGGNGRLDEDSIAYHLNGALNVARALGILDTPPAPFKNRRVVCEDYLWVGTPVDGEFHAEVEPAEEVVEGQRVGTIRSLFGETLAEIHAPATGLVLWRMTQPTLKAGTAALAVAIRERAEAPADTIGTDSLS